MKGGSSHHHSNNSNSNITRKPKGRGGSPAWLPSMRSEEVYGIIKLKIERINERALLHGVPGKLTASQWITLVLFQKHTCKRCMKFCPWLTIDHIIPMSAGGHNTIDNVQGLCMECNYAKMYEHDIVLQRLSVGIQKTIGYELSKPYKYGPMDIDEVLNRTIKIILHAIQDKEVEFTSMQGRIRPCKVTPINQTVPKTIKKPDSRKPAHRIIGYKPTAKG